MPKVPEGRCNRLKGRYHLQMVNGEPSTVTPASLFETGLPDLLAACPPQNIFNLDKASFFQSQPNASLVICNEKATHKETRVDEGSFFAKWCPQVDNHPEEKNLLC